MKVRIEHDVLAEAVGWVARGLPTRPSVPILAGMSVDAADGQVTLSGFDYESSTQVSVPAEVADPGRRLVSGRLLADICKSLPGESVDLETDAAWMRLTSGSSRFVLHTLPLEEYPALPEVPAASGVISGEALARAVGQVMTAAGRDDTLPVFTAIKLEFAEDTVALLATDRYRLAVREIPWQAVPGAAAADAPRSVLVPAKVLNEVAKAMVRGDVTLAVGTTTTGGDGLIGFEGSGRLATSRLLDGDFPKVRTLIPAESAVTARIIVDTAALSAAAKRVALVTERSAPIRITFEPELATLTAGSGDHAEATETIEATLLGEPLTAGFNSDYLLGGLGALGTPLARFEFTQPTKAVNLTGLKAPDDQPPPGDAYILMPMRLTTG